MKMREDLKFTYDLIILTKLEITIFFSLTLSGKKIFFVFLIG